MKGVVQSVLGVEGEGEPRVADVAGEDLPEGGEGPVGCRVRMMVKTIWHRFTPRPTVPLTVAKQRDGHLAEGDGDEHALPPE